MDALTLAADRIDSAVERDLIAADYLSNPAGWVHSKLGEHLWSAQVRIAESVRDNRLTAVQSSHGIGKALALDTPLPTPTGWTTMKDVRAGDQLLDEHGRPVAVISCSEVQTRPTYAVTFDDGSTITASDNHLWQVIDLRTRGRLRMRRRMRGQSAPDDWRDYWNESETRSTTDLSRHLYLGKQLRWGIPTCRPIIGEKTQFPVPGYTLGAWLGDGITVNAAITVGHSDAEHLLRQLELDGTTVRERPSARREGSTCYGLIGQTTAGLRAMGVLGNKHVPESVLRADEDTRLAVLQGLMDTDGFVSSGCSVGLDLTNQRLSEGAAELARSFGWKVRASTKRAMLYGKDCGTVYRLDFRPDRAVFRMPRKADRFVPRTAQRSRHTIRTIVAVDPVPVVPTKCVTVDSPTSLYLAGESFIPTHNSWTASRLTAWWLDTHPPGEAFVVTTAPTADQVKAILWAEINKAFAKAEARGTPLPGRINETDWKLGKFLIAFGRKPSDYNPHAFQGIHAKYVLVVVDEACGVTKQFWTAASAIATGEHCRILAIGNPDDPGSHFSRVCNSGRWNTIKVSAFDTPNFTGEQVPDDLAPMLVSRAYVEEMADEFGEESPTYISKVLGEFPSDAEDGVVPLSKLLACTREPATAHPAGRLVPVELGVDLGAGGDETCIRERRGPVVGREWRTREKDSDKVVDLIIQAIRATGSTRVKVDSIGIGWGIVGSLNEKRRRGLHSAEIVGVNVSEASTQPEKFARMRSQIWWEVGRQLSEDGGWDLSQIDSTDRDRLVSQLTAPKYSLDASGRIVVEKKDDTKKRIGRSPDNADALLLAFYVSTAPKPGIRVMR